jgi:hypothetical protein
MELLKKIDCDRGDVPRSRFIIRLMEIALIDSKDKNAKNKDMIPADQSFHAQSTGIDC